MVSHSYMYCLIAVLATIENDIQDVSVFAGERATFTCEFRKGSVSDIAINWSVGDILFNECDSTEDDIAPDGNGCYTNDTHSVLVLRNTSSLATGGHPVQCILEQNIPDDFKNDPSFQETIYQKSIERAFLWIYSGMLKYGTGVFTHTNFVSMPLIEMTLRMFHCQFVVVGMISSVYGSITQMNWTVTNLFMQCSVHTNCYMSLPKWAVQYSNWAVMNRCLGSDKHRFNSIH